MKRYIRKFTLLSAVFTMSFLVSCSSDDRVFEEQGQVRMTRQIEKIKNDLEGAANGWVMRYYPSPDFVGGFVFLLDFEEGKVTLQSDFQSDAEQSLYKIYGGEGPVLSFSEYSALHMLSDPAYPPAGTGFRGDFEFVVMESSADSVVLKGRKWDQKVTLSPATDADWAGITQLRKNETILAPVGENTPFFRNLYVDGNPAATFLYNSERRFLEYYFKDASGILRSGEVGVSFTKGGFQLQTPITVHGEFIHEFTLNSAGDGFTFGDKGALLVENEPVVSFNDSWNQAFDFTFMMVNRLSPDFYQLYQDAKTVQPDFQTMAFYWQLGQDYLKTCTFIFDNQDTENRDLRYYHAAIGAVENPVEDEAIFKPLVNFMGVPVFYMGGNANFQEYQQYFEANSEDSEHFKAILDLVYNDQGFTIIPTRDGNFYFVNKQYSNYWMLLTPYK